MSNRLKLLLLAAVIVAIAAVGYAKLSNKSVNNQQTSSVELNTSKADSGDPEDVAAVQEENIVTGDINDAPQIMAQDQDDQTINNFTGALNDEALQ